MNTTEKSTQEKTVVPIPDKHTGFYNSTTITKSPAEIYEFCLNEQNVEKALKDLPLGLENFLDLNLISSESTGNDQFEIRWENKPNSIVKGTLTFQLKNAPANRGTVIYATAAFNELQLKDQEPSDLVHYFLKRMKCLVETGEIPTTKGQPSGRDELSPSEDKTLH